MNLWLLDDPQPRAPGRTWLGELLGFCSVVIAAAGVAILCYQALAVVLAAWSGRNL